MCEDYDLEVFIRVTSLVSLFAQGHCNVYRAFTLFSALFLAYQTTEISVFFLQVLIICHSDQSGTVYVYIIQVVIRHTS